MLLQNEDVDKKENMEQRNRGFNSREAERRVLRGQTDRRPRWQPAEMGKERCIWGAGVPWKRSLLYCLL